MAKLKGPLFSLGASQQLGKAVVYFPWKGLNVVREYVIPSNPNTTAQQTQRGYIKDAVTLIHGTQAIAGVWSERDVTAYALWASVVQAATTWFNQAVRNFIDQKVAGKTGHFYCDHSTTPGVDQLAVQTRFYPGTITTGNFWYGTSKTALINSFAADIAGGLATATITPLTTGVKYFWQFKPTAPAGSIGALSGIHYGVPT